MEEEKKKGRWDDMGCLSPKKYSSKEKSAEVYMYP